MSESDIDKSDFSSRHHGFCSESGCAGGVDGATSLQHLRRPENRVHDRPGGKTSITLERQEGMGHLPALAHVTASPLAGRRGSSALQSTPSSRLCPGRQVRRLNGEVGQHDMRGHHVHRGDLHRRDMAEQRDWGGMALLGGRGDPRDLHRLAHLRVCRPATGALICGPPMTGRAARSWLEWLSVSQG
mgnify:CR=1 FL=1